MPDLLRPEEDGYLWATVHDDGSIYPWSLDCEYPYTTLPVVICNRCWTVVPKNYRGQHDAWHDQLPPTPATRRARDKSRNLS